MIKLGIRCPLVYLNVQVTIRAWFFTFQLELCDNQDKKIIVKNIMWLALLVHK